MLGASLRRFKNNSIHPYPNHQDDQENKQRKLTVAISSSSQQIASYLQKKVSFIHSKKLLQHFRELDLKVKRQPSFSTTSTVLFDSDEHLPSSKKPLPPSPKKSQTMTGFAEFKPHDVCAHDASHLPSEDSISFSGNSIEQISISTIRGGLTRASTWVGRSLKSLLKPASNEQILFNEQSSLFEFQDNYPRALDLGNCDKRLKLHCKILQITNFSSSKTYPYTLNMHVTNNESQSYSGIMKRIGRGVSTSNPHATLSFTVQGQFALECDLSIEVTNSPSIISRLKKIGKNNSVDVVHEEEEFDNVVTAHLHLDSGDDPLYSFANQGIGRYAIQTSPLQNPSLALELTISFWLEEYNHCPLEAEMQIDHDVLMFCQGGDYLTFYVKGESYPKWIRYWVTYEKQELVLRLNERREEPIERISLNRLVQVNTYPTNDIQEDIYLGKKYIIILSFGQADEMYLFADSSKSVRYWKCLLESMTSDGSDNEQQHINKRYIWSS